MGSPCPRATKSHSSESRFSNISRNFSKRKLQEDALSQALYRQDLIAFLYPHVTGKGPENSERVHTMRVTLSGSAGI